MTPLDCALALADAFDAASVPYAIGGALGKTRYFLSPEALAVFKLLFFRAKDVADLERLRAMMGDALDVGYVRAQLVTMLGEEDERVARWDVLTGA